MPICKICFEEYEDDELDNGICDNCKSLLLTKDGIDLGLG